MENLLDYLLYALFGHNVTEVHAHEGSGSSTIKGRSWTIVFEGQVYITLDEYDLNVIRNIYNERYACLNNVERFRYERIFDLCV